MSDDQIVSCLKSFAKMLADPSGRRARAFEVFLV